MIELDDSSDESIKPNEQVVNTEKIGLLTNSHTIEPTSLSFANISYWINTKHGEQQILHGVCGYVPAGKIMAIMGASGAGKTTLLDVLAGRNKQGEVEGTILVNGQPRPLDFEKISGYVMQDDALVETLTVRETLYYALKFRTPQHNWVRPEEENAIIDDIIDVLNLRKVVDTQIGDPLKRGISGGERRRLSIGIEMVIRPAIIFMDEPTSGLDARNALRVVCAIRHLCRTCGHTIIATIHQPRSNIFKMFDYLLLMSEGRMIYYGISKNAVEYFRKNGISCPDSMNPADFLLDILDPEITLDTFSELSKKTVAISEFPKMFKKSPEYSEISQYISHKEEDETVGSFDYSKKNFRC